GQLGAVAPELEEPVDPGGVVAGPAGHDGVVGQALAEGGQGPAEVDRGRGGGGGAGGGRRGRPRPHPGQIVVPGRLGPGRPGVARDRRDRGPGGPERGPGRGDGQGRRGQAGPAGGG